SKFVKQQVAGDFEGEVSEEEDAGEQAELFAGDGQVAVHGEGREADVDAIEEADDVEKEDKRDDAKSEFAEEGALVDGRVGRRGHRHVVGGSLRHLNREKRAGFLSSNVDDLVDDGSLENAGVIFGGERSIESRR